MSSYHSYFTYRDYSSLGKGLVICAFNADNGDSSAFLGMESIYTENPHTGVRYDYGAKYNNVANFEITLKTFDNSDFSVERFRDVARWLSGATKSSWLDLYEGNALAYSFLCRCVDIQHYKMDARIIGVTATFESVSPWAYSPMQTITRQVVNRSLEEYKDSWEERKGYQGLIGDLAGGEKHGWPIVIDNLSDEQYSYLYPNIEFSNQLVYKFTGDNKTKNFVLRHRLPNLTSLTIDGEEVTSDDYLYKESVIFFNSAPKQGAEICAFGNFGETDLFILNKTTKELAIVSNIAVDEVITINNNHLIYSSKGTRIFGKDFNLVWPRLVPGENVITTAGTGTLKITYRYPIKIGDCAININANLHGPVCELSQREVATSGKIEETFMDIYINVFGGVI
jgi:hypothetical protein